MSNIYTQLKVAGVRINSTGQIHKDDIRKAEPILREYLKAMPVNIQKTDFGLKDPAKNLKMFRSLQKRKGVLLKDLGDYQLYGYPTYVALLNMEAQHVFYLVQFERKMVFGKKAVTQVLLWRERPNKFVADLRIDGLKLTAYVFFKVLFSSGECIVTDNMQTKMGREFWEDRISDAWLYGYPVYYINQVSLEKIRLIPENYERIVTEYDVWGDAEISKAKKIAICKSAFWGVNTEK